MQCNLPIDGLSTMQLLTGQSTELWASFDLTIDMLTKKIDICAKRIDHAIHDLTEVARVLAKQQDAIVRAKMHQKWKDVDWFDLEQVAKAICSCCASDLFPAAKTELLIRLEKGTITASKALECFQNASIQIQFQNQHTHFTTLFHTQLAQLKKQKPSFFRNTMIPQMHRFIAEHPSFTSGDLIDLYQKLTDSKRQLDYKYYQKILNPAIEVLKKEEKATIKPLDVCKRRKSLQYASLDQQKKTLECDLYSTQACHLEADKPYLGEIEKLSFTNNDLEHLLPEVPFLSKLNCLNLSYNSFVILPTSLGTLNSLVILNLSHNSLQHLPLDLSGLECLKKLNLEFNDLANWFEHNPVLPLSLEQLNLRDNRLSSVPTALSRLSALQDLNLENNKIKELLCDLNCWPQMEQLNLIANPLKLPWPLPPLIRTMEQEGRLLFNLSVDNL